jgi:(2R)-sulfolactate sulfo-lyase subunit alpha
LEGVYLVLSTNSAEQIKQKKVSKHKFLFHHKNDDVGVVTTPIEKGEQVIGVCMEDDSEISIKAKADIPLGHKIALKDFEEGQPVSEYNTQIGITTTKWSIGDYVHTHNIKTARW